ncbi:hypothetical protein [Serratia nevei]|uniref:hypothetical protein n=1 Tax=Serratia nevei TaxID=2703794 RepID=UPI0025501176|nr:hypothetical protein [Serratia nevei]MDK5165493.1 hypothetical protein [Serratia nevei]
MKNNVNHRAASPCFTRDDLLMDESVFAMGKANEECFEEFLKKHPSNLMFSDEEARNIDVIEQFRAAGLPVSDEIVKEAKLFCQIHYS